MCNEVEDIRLNLPDLAKVTYVFFSVLDSSQTHWSLVIISIAKQLVVHYTSLPRPYENQDVVKSLVTRIAKWCRWTKVRVEEMEGAPRQSSIDENCSVYICITMRYLLIRRLLQADPYQQISIQLLDKKLDGAKGRSQIIILVHYYLANNLLLSN